MTDPAATEELHISRLFAAPRELVFRAFIEPAQLSQWFGPVGWSVPIDTVDIDPRPGGNYNFTMVNDDDPTQQSPANAKFTELVENELIVGKEIWESPDSGPTEMYIRIELADEGDQTRVTLRQGPYTPEIAKMATEGWESSFTKLDKVLDPG
jgi:uncharacterized protein YndB with AHSA1/START domain